MSALPVLRLASENEPVWLPASLAALRSGYSSGHLRRMCLRLEKSGYARQEKLDNGQKGWVIREDADPKFAEVKPAQQLDRQFCVAELPQKLQQVIQDRKRVLALVEGKRGEWQQQKRVFRDALAEYLRWLFDNEGIHGRKAEEPISVATYYGWAKRLKEQGDRGLLDNRMEDRPTTLGDDPFVAEVLRLWLTQQKRDVTLCHQMALDTAEERGWQVHPYKTVASYIFEWSKANRTEVERLRYGQKAYTDNCKPFVECDYSTLHSNEQWCADHHQFDVVVQVSPAYEYTDVRTGERKQVPARYARPWLTAWQDLRSRKIVGYVISLAPNQDTINRALWRGITSHGLCQMTYVDNGKDFDAWSLQGITKFQRRKLRVQYNAADMQGLYGILGIHTVHCEPYHGQSKPIERFFRTVCSRFSKLYETYCGNSPEDRPDNCFEKVKAGHAPNWETFVDDFGRWVEHDYHQRIHRGDSMHVSPARAWEANLVTKVVVDPRVAELLKRRAAKPSSVGQGTLTWCKITYSAPELLRRVDQEVYIRFDADDVNEISVWTQDNQFICFAAPKQRIPRSAARYDQVQEALQQVRSDARIQRQMVGVRVRAGQSLAQRSLAIARQKAEAAQATAPTLPPAPLAIARTAIDSQIEEYERRAELRMAVGSELGQRTGRSLEDLESIFGRDQ